MIPGFWPHQIRWGRLCEVQVLQRKRDLVFGYVRSELCFGHPSGD